MSQQTSANWLVISYLGLRKAVGMIGIALPFVLAFGKIIFEGPGIEPSVSNYYYTVMRDVFVGAMCATAVFLLSYRGYERTDDIAGDIAGVCALGTALFPTTPHVDVTPQYTWEGVLHLSFAAVFFLTLAFFCLFLFRKTDPTKPPTRRKLQRNAVYTVCGYTILICLGLIAVLAFISDASPIKHLTPSFGSKRSLRSRSAHPGSSKARRY
jgi:amino acid transporter